MNSVSAAVCGGNFGRVEDGNVRVGLPGAPGWTTIGFVSRFCAETGASNKQARATAAKNLKSVTEYKHFISPKIPNVGGVYLTINWPPVRIAAASRVGSPEVQELPHLLHRGKAAVVKAVNLRRFEFVLN
jgi:hypothetical protein